MIPPKKITIEVIFEQAKEHIDQNGKELILKSYNIAKKAHAKQRRKTGEPFITHPMIVAYYVAFVGLGKDAISAALLHDVIEDTPLTKDDISKDFGEEIAYLVDSVSKLRHTHFSSKYDEELENIRKFIIAAAKDIRVLIIKLADRLHNAQTIGGLGKERQQSYAKEIESIFVPLAEYIGIHSFKRNLENIAFRTLNPKRYETIKKYLHQHHKDHERYVAKYEDIVKRELKRNGLRNVSIESRAKSIASIDKKIQKYLQEEKIKNEDDFWSIYDYYALRIVARTEKDCYTGLGIVQNIWEPLEDEFDDYIAKPKPNGYRSIHTTVKTNAGKLIEIQIRTNQMHFENEFGPASHIAYKLSGKRFTEATNMFNWVSSLFRWRNSNTISKRDFEIDIFKKNIFVLTPNQEVKELVKGATPVDFAYAVHTQIGNACRGAKVNGHIVSLNTILKTGDVVEIITEKTAKYPIKDWLNFVKSAGTRSHINRALREKEEEIAVKDGEQKFWDILKKHRLTISDLTEDQRHKLYKKYNITKDAELFAKIGFNIITASSVYNTLYQKTPIQKKRIEKKQTHNAISIEGSVDSIYTLAKCCSPEHGDKIVALTTVYKGIRIHTFDCPNLLKYENERHLDAQWI